MWSCFLSGTAQLDIKDIYVHGYLQFGERIAEDYDELINQALADICEDPHRIGAKPVPGKDDGLHQYPLSLSKKRTQGKIKKPKHVVLYYIFARERAIVIARVLREGREQEQKKINRARVMDDLD
ncbi:MAG: type II toxin-antitoxin system RelE/ParE family toxin [Cyanobacteria bacterium J06639_14]